MAYQTTPAATTAKRIVSVTVREVLRLGLGM
jgi:hypothetical protein